MAKAKRKAAASRNAKARRKTKKISFPISSSGAVHIEQSDRPVTDSTFGGMLKRLFALSPESTAGKQTAKAAKKTSKKAKPKAKRKAK